MMALSRFYRPKKHPLRFLGLLPQTMMPSPIHPRPLLLPKPVQIIPYARSYELHPSLCFSTRRDDLLRPRSSRHIKCLESSSQIP